MLINRKLAVPGFCIGLYLAACCATGARGAETYNAGQKVEVREGDTWSPAMVLGQEGRKYHIHYDGSDPASDEWVTTDRIRLPGTSAATPATGAAGGTLPAPSNAKQPPGRANAAFAVDDKIECKWGGIWRKAVVVRKHDDWTLVLYDNVWYEWVQPWRLRTVGSKTDTTKDSWPRGNVSKSTPAPTEPPDEAKTGNSNGSDHDAHNRLHPSTPVAPGSDADPWHVSETVGPQGIAITKPELTGHDVEPGEPAGVPAPDASQTAPPPRMISLHHGAPKPGVETSIVANPQSHYALLSFVPMSNEEPVSIQRIELGRSDSDRVVPLVAHVLPLAISLDGKRMITRSDKLTPGTKWRMDLWSIDDDSAKPLLSFRPYDPSDNGADEVLWAQYVDANHLLSCSGGNTLTLWEISDTSVREIYTLQGDGTVHPQMSAGGKYVVVGFGGQAVVCEALTGKCVARVGALLDADGMISSLSMNVKRLALAGQRRLIVCDLAENKVLMDIGLPDGVIGFNADWVTPNLLLLDNRWLFDVDRKAMVWEYTLSDSAAEAMAPVGRHMRLGRHMEAPPASAAMPLRAPLARFMSDRVWFLAESGTAYAGGSGHSLFTSMEVPDEQVEQLDKHLPEGSYAIALGTPITLQVNVNAPDDVRKKIVDRLTHRLQDAGLVVMDGQSTQLVAETKQVDPHQVTYHSNFGGSGSETVTIADTEQSLSFIVDSKPVWTISSLTHESAPMIVWHKKDKSIADTLSDENKPKFEWFLQTGLPRSILKPVDPAGSSPFGMVGGRSRNRR